MSTFSWCKLEEDPSHVCDWFVCESIVHCTIESFSLTCEGYEVLKISPKCKV